MRARVRRVLPSTALRSPPFHLTPTVLARARLDLAPTPWAQFFGASNFNGDIGTWDTSRVTSMNHMVRRTLSNSQSQVPHTQASRPPPRDRHIPCEGACALVCGACSPSYTL